MLKVLFYEDSQIPLLKQAPLYQSFAQHTLLLLPFSQPITQITINQLLHKHSLLSSECIALVTSPSSQQIFASVNIVTIGYQPANTSHTYLSCSVVFEDLSSFTYATLLEEYNRAYNIPVDILATKRLTVRELALTDMFDLYQIYQEAEHIQHIEPMQSFEEECEKLSAYQRHIYQFYRFGLWGVFLRNNNTLIGRCGLQCVELEDDTFVELAYLIARPYCHQGYAYEVCTSILEYAKKELELPTLIALIREENLASLSLIQKLDFHYVKTISYQDHNTALYRIDF